jgi:hypothetical protein
MLDEILEQPRLDLRLLRSAEVLERIRSDYFPLMKGYPALVADLLVALGRVSSESTSSSAAVVRAEACSLGWSLVRDLDPHALPAASADDDALVAAVRALWPALRDQHSRLVERMAGALDSGDLAAIEASLLALRNGWHGAHARLVGTVNDLLETARRECGGNGLEWLLREAALPMRPVLGRWSALPARERSVALGRLLIAHGSIFSHFRSGDRVGLDIHSCASGGALLAARLERGEALEGPLQERSAWSAYCSHCRVWNEALPRAWFGRAVFEVVADARDPRRCTLLLSEAPE